jgi:hypothetical protein
VGTEFGCVSPSLFCFGLDAQFTDDSLQNFVGFDQLLVFA